MRISDVRAFEVSAPVDVEGPEERQVGMLAIYPDYAHVSNARPPADGRLRACYVQVDTDAGLSGLFGPTYPEAALIAVRRHRPLLLGQDALAQERLWDVLYRADRHNRQGYAMVAISAIDCALWDLRGKACGQPAYRLLGGPTRDRVECYASMNAYSHDPVRVRERAQWAVAQGYKAQKWFFACGPRDGLEGMERNVALVRHVREAVGPSVPIMFDAFMGWDLAYALRFIERVAEYRIAWLEEPVPPDRINDLAAIRHAAAAHGMALATGEGEYTRWGFLKLLAAEAADVLQPDPDWCGGISELVKICTLASAHGRQVYPHGFSVPGALNVIAAQPPATCPLLEFLPHRQPRTQHFHTTFLQPAGGALPLPAAPGLGIEIDESKVERRRDLLAGA